MKCQVNLATAGADRDRATVLDGAGQAVCTIRTTHVEIRRYADLEPVLERFDVVDPLAPGGRHP